MTQDMKTRIQSFSTLPARECRHQLHRNGGGGVFYNSVNLVYCMRCGGWQDMKKPVK